MLIESSDGAGKEEVPLAIRQLIFSRPQVMQGGEFQRLAGSASYDPAGNSLLGITTNDQGY